MIIDKSNGKTLEKEFNEKFDMPEDSLVSRRIFSAFLGVIKILDQFFLFMVDDVLQVCVMEGHNIYQISSISFVSFEVKRYKYQKIVLNF